MGPGWSPGEHHISSIWSLTPGHCNSLIANGLIDSYQTKRVRFHEHHKKEVCLVIYNGQLCQTLFENLKQANGTITSVQGCY